MQASRALFGCLLAVTILVARSSSSTGPASTMAAGPTLLIHDFAYSPSTISVKVGTTVTWTNNLYPGFTGTVTL